MRPWHEVLELPEAGNMMYSGSEQARHDFIWIGTSIFEALEHEIVNFFGRVQDDARILDFGCGVGRVALPFYHAHQKPTDACDTNKNVIDYMRRALPDTSPIATHFLPPLPYTDNTFDCVYSISVWTHLPLHLQWTWLREINRVLKMGGLALLTTSSFKPLSLRRKNPKIPGWAGISDDDLRLEGVIYRKGTAALAGNPGADPDFGYVCHDPQWVAHEWGRLFEYRGCRVEGIAAMQDLHVMSKCRNVGPSDLTELV